MADQIAREKGSAPDSTPCPEPGCDKKLKLTAWPDGGVSTESCTCGEKKPSTEKASTGPALAREQGSTIKEGTDIDV